MSLSDLFEPAHSYRNLAFVGRSAVCGGARASRRPTRVDIRRPAAAIDKSYDLVDQQGRRQGGRS
jgi:hypothetical protein